MRFQQSVIAAWFAIGAAILAPLASAEMSFIDTGTFRYWDGNLPACFIYHALSTTPPGAGTGTMSYGDESGLMAQYIFNHFRETGPFVAGWFSARDHANDVGTMALELSTTSVTSESRHGGIQDIRVVFSSPVEAADGNLDVGEVIVSGMTGGAKVPTMVSLSMDGLTLFVDFAPGVLSDGDTYTFDITGKFVGEAAGLPVETGRLTCVANGLVGDVNNSGNINLIDVAAVRTMKNNNVDATNFSFDVNRDGAIDLIDVALTRSVHGNQVP